MKAFRKITAAVLALSLMPVYPEGVLTAFAQQSPDFARSAEEWAALRDDRLEFDEIPALIHEYNSTVLQNAISYKDSIGKDSTDIADSYYDAADQIYNNMEYPDEESSNYASAVNSYLNAQLSYERLMEQGDNNTNDAETIKLGYDRTEANLAKQAQDQMITYWTQLTQLESQRASVAQAESELQAVALRIAAGTATEANRKSAEETLLNAQASLASAESTLQSTKDNLIMMMGWSHGANVDIAALPEPDPAAIIAVNPAADIETAKANNYSLKSTVKQLANARTETVRETLTETKRTAEENIASNITSLYEAMKLSLSSYNQAQEALSIQQAAAETAERKKAAGTITQNGYQQIQTALTRARVTVNVRKLDLLKAYVDYQWAVNGLAST